MRASITWSPREACAPFLQRFLAALRFCKGGGNDGDACERQRTSYGSGSAREGAEAPGREWDRPGGSRTAREGVEPPGRQSMEAAPWPADDPTPAPPPPSSAPPSPPRAAPPRCAATARGRNGRSGRAVGSGGRVGRSGRAVGSGGRISRLGWAVEVRCRVVGRWPGPLCGAVGLGGQVGRSGWAIELGRWPGRSDWAFGLGSRAGPLGCASGIERRVRTAAGWGVRTQTQTQTQTTCGAASHPICSRWGGGRSSSSCLGRTLHPVADPHGPSTR